MTTYADFEDGWYIEGRSRSTRIRKWVAVIDGECVVACILTDQPLSPPTNIEIITEWMNKVDVDKACSIPPNYGFVGCIYPRDYWKDFSDLELYCPINIPLEAEFWAEDFIVGE